MSTRPPRTPRAGSSGASVVELMIALVFLAIGILAIARVFPLSTGSAIKSRMASAAGQYANEQCESLLGLSKSSPSLTAGRHPSAGYDSVGPGKKWTRYYVVTKLNAPLDSLYRIDSVVRWTSSKVESTTLSVYLFP